MKPYIRILTLAIAAAGILTGVQPASAHDSDRGRGHSHHDSRHDDRDDGRWDNDRPRNRYDRYPKDYWQINLSHREKNDIRWKLEDAYERKCSTVAGRRYYKCLPPGHSYYYRVGTPLPPHVVVWSVPYNVRSVLPKPHYGTRYVWADRDILLISDDTGIVLDVMRLIWG